MLHSFLNKNGLRAGGLSYEGSLSPHAISHAHVSHHEEVLAAPAGSQEREGDGARHTDEQEEEEAGTRLTRKERLLHSITGVGCVL